MQQELKGITKKQIQGEYQLELKFVDDRVFLNYWDWANGKDVCVQIKDGKLLKYIYTEADTEKADFEGNLMEQKEITITEFVDQVKDSISSISI